MLRTIRSLALPTLLAAAALAFVAAPLRADSITTTDGRVFTGVIVEEKGEEVKLKMKLGVRPFKKSEIKQITREAVDESADFLKELDKAVAIAESGKPLSSLNEMKKLKDKYADAPVLKNAEKESEAITKILAGHPRVTVKDTTKSFGALIEDLTESTQGLCKRCEGSGTQNCTLCKGKAGQPCSFCKNKRTQPCGGCQGTGRDNSVDGKFERDCPDCAESTGPDGKKKKGYRWSSKEEYNPANGTTAVVEQWVKCARCLGRGIVAIREGINRPWGSGKKNPAVPGQTDPGSTDQGGDSSGGD